VGVPQCNAHTKRFQRPVIVVPPDAQISIYQSRLCFTGTSHPGHYFVPLRNHAGALLWNTGEGRHYVNHAITECRRLSPQDDH